MTRDPHDPTRRVGLRIFSTRVFTRINPSSHWLIFDHIFGKRQKVQNEVELYLKASRAEPQQDILLWWKVMYYY